MNCTFSGNKCTSTNFEKVIEFNRSFGVPIKEKVDKTVFDTDVKLVKYRMSLINEEVAELNQAVKDKNMTETVDALADILYVVYGMGASLGINLDNAYNIVHASNMSKLCKTEEEAKETIEWYLKNEKRYDTPKYRLSQDKNHYVVYNESTQKVLKNVYYKPADFSNMLKE
jgi:predicted HAD superfamily Cof-like phosphohydrolase